MTVTANDGGGGHSTSAVTAVVTGTSWTASSTAFCQTSNASSARADCARTPASIRPALKIGSAKASATLEK